MQCTLLGHLIPIRRACLLFQNGVLINNVESFEVKVLDFLARLNTAILHSSMGTYFWFRE